MTSTEWGHFVQSRFCVWQDSAARAKCACAKPNSASCYFSARYGSPPLNVLYVVTLKIRTAVVLV